MTEEELVVHSDDPKWRGATVTVTISDIDASPTISIPSDISKHSG